MKNLSARIKHYLYRRRVRRAVNLIQAQGYLIIDRTQLEIARAYLQAEAQRLTKMGGGSASKFRQPRKTLRRLTRRLDKNLASLSQATPGQGGVPVKALSRKDRERVGSKGRSGVSHA